MKKKKKRNTENEQKTLVYLFIRNNHNTFFFFRINFHCYDDFQTVSCSGGSYPGSHIERRTYYWASPNL